VLREIFLLRKFTECQENVFTVKLLDIIFPSNFKDIDLKEESKTGELEIDLGDLDHIFLVMSAGQNDLKDVLESSSLLELTEDHVITVLYNLLCAVRFMHKAGVIHRDLKPANILIDDECKVQICDFGLARSAGKEDKDYQKLHRDLYKKVHRAPKEERKSREEQFKHGISNYLKSRKSTEKRDRTCCVMTRWYRAPEVMLTYEQYGKAADIWSIGIIISELMACSSAYSKNSDFSTKSRFMFKGKCSFPISPNKEDDFPSLND
jgi:mitogen-activated protein kinase 1/3